MTGQEIFSSSYDHSVLSHPCPNTGRAVCVCFGPDFGGTPVTTPTGWEDSVQAKWGLAFHISHPACYSASATLPDTPVPAVTTPTGWEDSIQARWGLAFHNTSHTQPATVPVPPYLTHLYQQWQHQQGGRIAYRQGEAWHFTTHLTPSLLQCQCHPTWHTCTSSDNTNRVGG